MFLFLLSFKFNRSLSSVTLIKIPLGSLLSSDNVKFTKLALIIHIVLSKSLFRFLL